MTNDTTTLADRIVERLTAQRGEWVTADQMIDLAPIVPTARVAYAHELDDMETPGPSWGYGHDATGLAAEQPGGTVNRPDRDLLIATLTALARDGRIERVERAAWFEYRVS